MAGFFVYLGGVNVKAGRSIDVQGVIYTYEQYNLEAHVTGHTNFYYDNIVISDAILVDSKSYKVTKISDSAFHECSRLTSIVIKSGEVEIEGNAFTGCDNLKTAIVRPQINTTNIPESVNIIRTEHFVTYADGKTYKDMWIDSSGLALQPGAVSSADEYLIGWYTDVEYETLFDFSTEIGADTILYGKYETIIPVNTYWYTPYQGSNSKILAAYTDSEGEIHKLTDTGFEEGSATDLIGTVGECISDENNKLYINGLGRIVAINPTSEPKIAIANILGYTTNENSWALVNGIAEGDLFTVYAPAYTRNEYTVTKNSDVGTGKKFGDLYEIQNAGEVKIKEGSTEVVVSEQTDFSFPVTCNVEITASGTAVATEENCVYLYPPTYDAKSGKVTFIAQRSIVRSEIKECGILLGDFRDGSVVTNQLNLDNPDLLTFTGDKTEQFGTVIFSKLVNSGEESSWYGRGYVMLNDSKVVYSDAKNYTSIK